MTSSVYRRRRRRRIADSKRTREIEDAVGFQDVFLFLRLSPPFPMIVDHGDDHIGSIVERDNEEHDENKDSLSRKESSAKEKSRRDSKWIERGKKRRKKTEAKKRLRESVSHEISTGKKKDRKTIETMQENRSKGKHEDPLLVQKEEDGHFFSLDDLMNSCFHQD